MGRPVAVASDCLRFLGNQLYEYRKGVRRLVLMTIATRDAEAAIGRLDREGIPYCLQPVNEAKVNLFFGHPAWVDTARSLSTKPLNQLSPAEDFILGTLLGYDGEQQCRRFLARSGRRAACAVA